MKTPAQGLLAAVMLASLVGCGPTRPDAILNVSIGDTCTVYFRRDALGMAADSPSSPNTGSQNGADVAVYGEVIRFNDKWLVLTRENREFSVPVDAILMLEVSHK